MHRLVALLLAVVLSQAACWAPEGDVPSEWPAGAPGASAAPADSLSPDSLSGTFEGYFSADFEHTGFVPCADTTEAWWTEPAMTRDGEMATMSPGAADLYPRYEQVSADREGLYGEGVIVWARLLGRATPLTPSGHEGAYTRSFAVDSVLAMSADPPAGACPRPSHVRP